MKTLGIRFIFFCILLQLMGPAQARLLFGQNGPVSCKWAYRRCNKFTPVCVQVNVGGVTTCMHYRNDCQYRLDICQGRTEFGRTGTPVSFSMNCATIPQGLTGMC